MDGIQHEQLKFMRLLLEQLQQTNKHLEKIAEELTFRNDMEFPKIRSEEDHFGQ